MKRALTLFLGCIILLGVAVALKPKRPRRNHTSSLPISGLVLNDEKRAWPGFTVVGESGTALVRVLNMSGATVHSWNFDAARVRLLPNCNALVVHGTKWGWAQKEWKEARSKVREFDWNGSVVWEYEVPGPAHHDVHRLPNGNTLILYRTLVPKSAKSSIEDPAKQRANIRTDSIVEVTPSGEIIWEWHAHEHLDLNSCGKDPCLPLPESMIDGERLFDWTHTNSIFPLPENRFFDAGDTRFRPGNLLLTIRQWSTVLLIDRNSGDVVWKYTGNLSGGHEGIMLSKDFAGSGNILIFNNGRDQHRSEVLEIDPLSQESIWTFQDGEAFFSRVAGISQRLPNGNTLISEDVPGRIFEVSPAGERVWQYNAGIRVERAHRYAQEYCPQLSTLPLVGD